MVESNCIKRKAVIGEVMVKDMVVSIMGPWTLERPSSVVLVLDAQTLHSRMAPDDLSLQG